MKVKFNITLRGWVVVEAESVEEAKMKMMNDSVAAQKDSENSEDTRLTSIEVNTVEVLK